MKELVRTIQNNGYLIIRWRSNNLIGSPLSIIIIITIDFFQKKLGIYCLKNMVLVILGILMKMLRDINLIHTY